MAQFFKLISSTSCPAWQLLPAAERFALPLGVIARPVSDPIAGGERWLLLSPPDARARVNGEALLLGARILRHKDELQLAGERFFFSTERSAIVEPLPKLGHAVHCARCKQQMTDGSPAVRCPGCGAWHMQSKEYPCWTYGEKCSLCATPTELGSGLRWSPEGEGWS